MLFKKITDGIEKRYNDNSDFNLSYDLGLSDIVKQIYEENENQYNDILKEKIDKSCNYTLFEEYGICTTYTGEEYLFDIEDYEKIRKYNWTSNSDGYADTTVKGKHLPMHRLVMGCDNNSSFLTLCLGL